jgi:CO/xanthine dehydrogenase Mo-binding subunit
MAGIPLLQDIPFRSTFSVLTIRSPVPRGRLLSVECPPLERTYTLITAADIPGKNELADFPVPVLAAGEVYYLGEPVALLVGPDQAKLNAYARQCRVLVKEETPVFAAPASAGLPNAASNAASNGAAGGPANERAREGETAPKDGTPPAFPETSAEVPAGSGAGTSAPPAPAPPVPASPAPPAPAPASAPASAPAPAGDAAPGPEIFAEHGCRRGDPDAAFAAAARIVAGRYSTGIQEHAYGEPVGALVEYIGGFSPGGPSGASPGGLPPAGQSFFVVHTATQWPYHVSRSAAGVLGLDEGAIITEPTGLGLPMDGKIWYPSLIACQAVLAASITRRNVRLLLNREEDFRYSPKRNSSVTEIQSALDENGEVRGTRIDMTLDLGAYAVFAREILDQSCLGVRGAAGAGALDLKARAIRTNIPPQGPFGGFGAAQGAFAMERHQSRIADALALDPAEWRKNNRPGREGLAGFIPLREEAPVEQLLDTVAAMSDYYRKWASCELLRRRRRESPPARPEALRGVGVALGWQGSGFLHPGKAPCGVEVTLNIDGSLDIRTSMGAGRESIDIWSGIVRELLAVEDIRVVSRNVTTLSALVRKCCETIRNQRFRDPLPITVRESRPDSPEARDKARNEDPDEDPDLESCGRPGWGAAVVEVEIAEHSYTPSVRGVWLAVDGGGILSEEGARRGLKLAAVQALGWASGERLAYRDGALSPARISDYGLPNPAEIPAIHVDFLWSPGTEPKGVGDLPFHCVPAAYIQAVSQAIDHECQHIPLKPGAVWEVLRQKYQPRPPAGETEK